MQLRHAQVPEDDSKRSGQMREREGCVHYHRQSSYVGHAGRGGRGEEERHVSEK